MVHSGISWNTDVWWRRDGNTVRVTFGSIEFYPIRPCTKNSGGKSCPVSLAGLLQIKLA
jgi:hypothetical protein